MPPYYTPPRRSLTDYLLPFLIVVAIGIIIALLFNLWGTFNASSTLTNLSQPATAQVTVTAGEAEAYLPASGAWKIIGETGTNLSEGERVRTGAAAAATVMLQNGAKITLAPASELGFTELRTSLGTPQSTLNLVRGSAVFDFRQATGRDLILTTRLARFADFDGATLITTDTVGSMVDATAAVGSVTATVLDPAEGARKTDLKSVIVEGGTTLFLSEKKINLLRIGGEIELVKPTPKEITMSALYVAHIGAPTVPVTTDGTTTTTPVATTEATKTTPAQTDSSTTTPTTPTAESTSALLATPVITTPTAGATVTTEPVMLTGTVGAAAAKVFVTANGGPAYQLTKFVAGNGTWTYRASTTLGNLVDGANTFTVTAETADGVKSAAATIAFTFQKSVTSTAPAAATTTTTTTEAPVAPTKTTDGVPAITSDGFAVPTVTTPAEGEVFTAAPIVIRGTVPTGTTAVAVNGYTLTKFVAGQTSWYYTADPKYSNLKEGANEYEIMATGPNGEQSSVTLNITYTPAAAQ